MCINFSAIKASVSSTLLRHMRYTTGVSTTSSVSWKHSSFTVSAMPLPHFQMSSVIVLITGALAPILLIMSITHFSHLLVISKWRLALVLGWLVNWQTSIATFCWESFVLLMVVEDIKSHVASSSISLHVPITPQKFTSGWDSTLQRRLLLAMFSWLLRLPLWLTGHLQSTDDWGSYLMERTGDPSILVDGWYCPHSCKWLAGQKWYSSNEIMNLVGYTNGCAQSVQIKLIQKMDHIFTFAHICVKLQLKHATFPFISFLRSIFGCS